MAIRTILGVLLIAGINFSAIFPLAHAQDFNREELLRFAEQKSAEWENAIHIQDSLRKNYTGKLISGQSKKIFPGKSGLLPLFYQTSNLEAAEAVSNSKIWNGGIAGLDLSGSGEVIGFWDKDKPRLDHQEFSERVTFEDTAAGTINNHATQMVGTMAAEGKDPAAKGMVFAANVEAYNWDNDAAEMATAAAGDLKLSAHPYTNSAGWVYDYLDDGKWMWYSLAEYDSTKAYQFGYYDHQALEWDSIAYLAPDYLIVKAAGNQRGAGPDDQPVEHWELKDSDGEFVLFDTMAVRPVNGGGTGFETLTSASLSKNVLVVGAVKSTTGDFSDLTSIEALNGSGFGPTDDGRIKPDIVAPADGLYTTISSSPTSYGNSSGTSAATSVVTGSAALIAEHYQNIFSETFSSAGMKALLSHTVDDIGNPGPDYKHGWGMLNTERAARFLSAYQADDSMVSLTETTLSENGTISLTYQNTNNLPLKITIAWTDPAGTIPETANDPEDIILVNDLDLKVTDFNSEVFEPWVLDRELPDQNATTGSNSADNIEQVWIENPVKSNYEIGISHKGDLQSGSQKVAILISPEEPEIVRKTIANGSWENPSVWKDGVVPTGYYNQAQISHEVTLNNHTEIHSLSFEGENAQLNLDSFELTLSNSLYFTQDSKGFYGDSNSSLNITGWSGFSDPLKFAPGGEKLENFTLNIPENDTMHLASKLDMYGKIEIKNGVLSAGEGNLGLIADSNHIANLISGQGEISGTISYSRTYYQGEGWRLMSVPFRDVNFSSLNEHFHTQGGNWASYQVSEPNSNLWFFDAGTQSYTGYYGENSTFTAGSGFLMYMYDDFVDGTFSLPGAWEISGEEEISVSVPLHSAEAEEQSYNLVGNPFAGTLDWHQIVEDNPGIATNYAVWNPELTNGGGSAGFQYYNMLGGESPGAAGRFIAPMQGFFIQATEAEAEINFTQNQKAVDGSPVILGKEIEENISSWIQFHLLDEEDNVLEQEIYLVINPDASRSKDKSDVSRFNSLSGENNTLSFLGENGDKLAFEGRSMENDYEKFELLADIDRSGNYTIEWPIWKQIPEDWSISLKDEETGKTVDLRSQPGHSFTHQAKQSKQAHNQRLERITDKAESEPRFKITISSNPEKNEIPDYFLLHQNFPNPFNPVTVIRYQLPVNSHVQLRIFDLLGREVALLVNERMQEGNYEVNFDASQIASGIYVYRLKADDFLQSRKMTLIK
ncbi:MAG: S8 family peptidase [Balneolaceae bacterium]